MKHACAIPTPEFRVDILGKLNANAKGPAISPVYPEERDPLENSGSVCLKQFEHIGREELPDRLIYESFLDPDFVRRTYGLLVSLDDWKQVRQFANKMTAGGLDPNPYFNTHFYSACYGVDRSKCVAHYLAHGWRVGYWPSASFDPAIHLHVLPRARCAGCNPVSWLYRQGLASSKELAAQCGRQAALAPDKGVVSVVTINKDNGVGLERTLSSVAAQRGVDIQSIVIDGGSSDRSREVIAQFSNLIDAWISEPDRGIWHAQEKGLSRASGQWVIFMNSGDRFFDDVALSDLLNCGAYADIVHGYAIQDGWFSPMRFREFLYQGMPFSHQACIARRDLFDTVGFDSGCLVADFKFLIDAYVGGAIFEGTDVVVAGLQPIGVSTTQTVKRALARWAVVQRHFGSRYDGDYRGFITNLLGVEKPAK